MEEWWTYRLSDFLLFSPAIYFRQFELYNAAIWPGQILTMILGLVCLWLLWRPAGGWSERGVPAILAACWLWVAWGYLYSRYATINWAATYFAGAFLLQAVLLVLVGTFGRKLEFSGVRHPDGKLSWIRQAGPVLFLFGLIVYPLIGSLAGRPWAQAEMFGLTPNPTIAATLGMLLSARRMRWGLLVIPALWCLIEGATRLALATPDFWSLPALAMIAAILVAIQFAAVRERPT